MTSAELLNVIIAVRRVRNLTQADVAKRAKIARSTYALFEAGHIELKPDQVERVTKVIDAATPNAAARQKLAALAGNPELGLRFRRTARRDTGLSQVELAKLAGVPQTSVSLWERGRPEVRAEDLERINKTLQEHLANLHRSGVTSLPLAALARARDPEEVRQANESLNQAWGSAGNWEEVKALIKQVVAQEREISDLRNRIATLEKQNDTLLREWQAVKKEAN
jgi:transcriptional regulator with XRE-family HTH domain